MRCWIVAATMLLAASAAGAQQPARRPTPAAPVPTPPPVAAAPQQTTATFGDWIMRCTRPANAPKSCEVVQQVQQGGKPVAQTVIGTAGKGRPLQLMMVVPPSVSFAQKPALLPPAAGEAETAALTWQRCLPGACVADTEIGEAALAQMRGWTRPAHINFADGAGRPISLPLSPVGLPQALEALAKEDVD